MWESEQREGTKRRRPPISSFHLLLLTHTSSCSAILEPLKSPEVPAFNAFFCSLTTYRPLPFLLATSCQHTVIFSFYLSTFRAFETTFLKMSLHSCLLLFLLCLSLHACNARHFRAVDNNLEKKIIHFSNEVSAGFLFFFFHLFSLFIFISFSSSSTPYLHSLGFCRMMRRWVLNMRFQLYQRWSLPRQNNMERQKEVA